MTTFLNCDLPSYGLGQRPQIGLLLAPDWREREYHIERFCAARVFLRRLRGKSRRSPAGDIVPIRPARRHT